MSQAINGTGFDGKRWRLVDESGAAVTVGASVKDFRGQPTRIAGGNPPRKSSSVGHVSTESGGEFYASVFGLRWEHEPPSDSRGWEMGPLHAR